MDSSTSPSSTTSSLSDRNTIAVSLKKHLKDKELLEKIQTAVTTANDIVEQGLDFINLHVRRLLEQNTPLPSINQTFIRRCFGVVSHLDGKQRKCDYKELESTWQLFTQVSPTSVSRSGLVRVLDYAALQLVINIETNISYHFIARHLCYLRLYYDLDKKEATRLQNLIFDPSEGTTDERVLQERKYLPELTQSSLQEQLKKSPISFLPTMFHMLQTFEETRAVLELFQEEEEDKKDNKDENKLKELRKKMKLAKGFSLLPLRKGFVPKHITIDTSILAEWTTHSP